MEGSRLSAIGSAFADPNRAAMLAALQSGRAHTAGELARWCGIAPSTASTHLSKLVDAGLLNIEPAGRHRYYRIASVEIADLLETIDGIDLPETNKPQRPRRGTALAFARSCYDHLAGDLGVAIHDSMTANEWLAQADVPQLTTVGAHQLAARGLDITPLQVGRRAMVRNCLDWTAREHHLGGSVGAALLDHMLANRWLRHARDHRVLRVTDAGRWALDEQFHVDVRALEQAALT